MENEIDIRHYIEILKKWREFIISFISLVVIITVLFCLVMPWTYRARTTILIPTQNKGLESVLALSSILGSSSNQSSGLSADLSQSLVGRSTNYSDILQSTTLSRMIVEGLNLDKYYRTKNSAKVTGMVQKGLKVKESKGILTVYSESGDPRLATDIANYAALSLNEFNKKGNAQYAKRLKNFIMEQLAQSGVDLAQAEENYKKFETQSQMVRMSQKELMVERLLRDVKVKEAIYTMLMQEYEKAKIEEVKEDLFFEVLDPAQGSAGLYKPRPLLYSVIALVLGSMCAVLLAFFFEFLEGFGIKLPQPDYRKEMAWLKKLKRS